MLITDSQGFHIRIIAITNGLVTKAEYIVNKRKVSPTELDYINKKYAGLWSTGVCDNHRDVIKSR